MVGKIGEGGMQAPKSLFNAARRKAARLAGTKLTFRSALSGLHLMKTPGRSQPEVALAETKLSPIMAEIKRLIDAGHSEDIPPGLINSAKTEALKVLASDTTLRGILEKMEFTGMYIDAGIAEELVNLPLPGIRADYGKTEVTIQYSHSEEGVIYISKYLADYLLASGVIQHMADENGGRQELLALIAYEMVKLAGSKEKDKEETAKKAEVAICHESKRKYNQGRADKSTLDDKKDELNRLAQAIYANRGQLSRYGFKAEEWLQKLFKYREGKISLIRNYWLGLDGYQPTIAPVPDDGKILDMKNLGDQLKKALEDIKENAFKTLTILNPNGGAATRFGELVKCLFPIAVFKGKPRPFIEIKAAITRFILKRLKASGTDPRLMWEIMNSFATDDDTRAYLKERNYFGLKPRVDKPKKKEGLPGEGGIAPEQYEAMKPNDYLSDSFVQGLSLRVIPTKADLTEMEKRERARIVDRREQIEKKRTLFGVTQEDVAELADLKQQEEELPTLMGKLSEQADEYGEGTVYFNPDEPTHSINPPGHLDTVMNYVISEARDEDGNIIKYTDTGKPVFKRPMLEELKRGNEIGQLSNIDNSTGNPDEEKAKLLIYSNNLIHSDKDLLTELAPKYPGDAGGAVAQVTHQVTHKEDTWIQLVEEFCMPPDYKHSNPYHPDTFIPDMNTATYYLRLRAFLRKVIFADYVKEHKDVTDDKLLRLYEDIPDDELLKLVAKARASFPVYAVIKNLTTKKTENGKVTEEPRAVIQFEQLLGDLSAKLDTLYVRVDREKDFNPVKKPEEAKRVSRILEEVLTKFLDFPDEILEDVESVRDLYALRAKREKMIAFSNRVPTADDKIPPLKIPIAQEAIPLVDEGHAKVLREETAFLSEERAYSLVLTGPDNKKFVNLEPGVGLPIHLHLPTSQLVMDPRLPSVTRSEVLMKGGTEEVVGYSYEGLRLFTDAREIKRDHISFGITVVKPNKTTPWMSYGDYAVIMQIVRGRGIIHTYPDEYATTSGLPGERFLIAPQARFYLKNTGDTPLVILRQTNDESPAVKPTSAESPAVKGEKK